MATLQNIQTQAHEPKTWPNVAIIVLNWNSWRDTIECLESLQRLTYPNYQIIVVDNGSPDDSVEMIKAWARGEIRVESKSFPGSGPRPVTMIEYTKSDAEARVFSIFEDRLKTLPSAQRLILIQNTENHGFSSGNNVAIRYALLRDYPYMGSLNNDTVFYHGFLNLLVRTLENNLSWVAVSPKIL